MQQAWKPEERKQLNEFLHENSLQASQDEVEMWIEALMADGQTFEHALGQAELMFCE